METRVYPFLNLRVFRPGRLVSKSLLPLRYQKKSIKHFVWARNSLIPRSFLNKRIAVHSGNKFSSFIVRPFMLGRKFGEFALTKRIGSVIHIKKIVKKKRGVSKKK